MWKFLSSQGHADRGARPRAKAYPRVRVLADNPGLSAPHQRAPPCLYFRAGYSRCFLTRRCPLESRAVGRTGGAFLEDIAELGNSGYIRLENKDTVVLFDAAPIGPDYQPGHAHADTLSLEVSHRGRRVLVNSGTSTYERGPERAKERGTAAHNTIVID